MSDIEDREYSTYRCPYCDELFSSEKAAVDHQNTHKRLTLEVFDGDDHYVIAMQSSPLRKVRLSRPLAFIFEITSEYSPRPKAISSYEHFKAGNDKRDFSHVH
jgi:hypothetical protein